MCLARRNGFKALASLLEERGGRLSVAEDEKEVPIQRRPNSDLAKYPVVPVDSEDYKVYSAVLRSKLAGGAKAFVIEGATGAFSFPNGQPDDGFAYHRKEMPLLNDDLINSFKAAAEKTYSLDRGFDLDRPYLIMGRYEEGRYFGYCGSWWDGYYRDFPETGGIMGFSRVGYSSDGKTALVYYDVSCGGLCGAGYYVFLVKTGNSWNVVQSSMIWVS
jgi:hypothetical protein